MDGQHVRRELGAYVLGALEREPRQVVERHLDQCMTCREELANLAAVRPLLDRLDPDDLPATEAESGDVRSLARQLARLRRRERLQLWSWRLAAVTAASALAVTTLVDTSPTVPTEPLVVRNVSAAAAGLDGSVDATPWEWGTTVALELTSLPRRDGYVVWVVATDGRREQAGTWGPTAAGRAVVRGASGIHVNEIAAVEITDADGDILVVFEPAPAD